MSKNAKVAEAVKVQQEKMELLDDHMAGLKGNLEDLASMPVLVLSSAIQSKWKTSWVIILRDRKKSKKKRQSKNTYKDVAAVHTVGREFVLK